MKLIAGLLPAASGELTLDGAPLAGMPRGERARRFAYLPQEGVVHWPLTVAQLIALGRLPHLARGQRPGEHDHAIIRRVMRQTGLESLQARRLDTLSGGERARALLARALAVEPEILLVDEPVAALDPAHQLEVMELLRRHCERGGAVLVILHDLRLASHYCDRLQLLHSGAGLAAGSPQKVLTRTNLSRAYGITLSPASLTAAEAFALTWELLPRRAEGQGP